MNIETILHSAERKPRKKEKGLGYAEGEVFFTGIWAVRSKSISSGSWSLSAFSARGQTRGSTTRILTFFLKVD